MPNILKNTSLKPYNTFGLEALAKYFAEVDSTNELLLLAKTKLFKTNPIFILGGGSNILLTQNFEGLVVKNNIKGVEKVEETEQDVLLRIGSGEIWHSLVLFCVDNGYGGIENLSLIPGTVGAAPMQNIGAYGVEIQDVFEELEALNLETLKIETFDKKACQFGYRESVFKHSLKEKYVITHVLLRLQKKPKLNLDYGAIKETLSEMEVRSPGIKEVSNAVVKIRQSKLPDPAEIGNSGSFFKNPIVTKTHFEKLKDQNTSMPSYPIDEESVKIPAGWLIEQAGWKGKTFGAIGVHKKQALVLVNYGGGKGTELKTLAEKIQLSVLEKYGITLHAEVNII